jgi:hypothetical protein
LKRLIFLIVLLPSVISALAEEPRTFTSDPESPELGESQTVKDRSFLWGLAGFVLTTAPGAIGLGVSAQSAPDFTDAATPLGRTVAAAAIGAGVSLFAALIRTGSPNVYQHLGFKYVKSTFYGDLVGFGTLSLAAMAIYPEILPYSLAVILIAVTEPLWGPLVQAGQQAGCISLNTIRDGKAVFVGFSIPTSVRLGDRNATQGHHDNRMKRDQLN